MTGSVRRYPDLLLFPQHEALLAASGISPEVAAARGYRSAETKAALERLGFSKAQRHAPALLLPVWSAVTAQIAFYQARPDLPRMNGDGKVIKYETPASAHMVIDAHPAIRKSLADPSDRLWITEGIKKADALVTAGECCLGLLGVWNWRGTNGVGGKTALPDWEVVALNGREVFVVFDSDVITKPEVNAALRRLGMFLGSRGARVQFVYLPAGDGGAKVGVDDFLAAGHRIEDLLAFATDRLQAPPVRTEAMSATGLNEVLLDASAFLSRFVAFGLSHQVTACVLWAAHTHVHGAFDVSPFLHVSSPERRSGKTRLLEALELLVRAPWRVVSPSEAVLFRKIDADHPTLLLDEVDTIFGRQRDEAHEPLRALLNAGNRRGVRIPRCVGDGAEIQIVEFDVFTPRVLAGIGALPDTVADRSIPIRLQRRAAHETVERFRIRQVAVEAQPVREALEHWMLAVEEPLCRAQPDVPGVLNDRATEIWEPLLAIADLAGGEWPRLARDAATALHTDPTAQDETAGVALLAALRDIFEAKSEDRLATADLIAALAEREDVALPDWWARAARDDLRSAGRWLARRLRAFGVAPDHWRAGPETVRGYLRAAFADTWARYAPPLSPGASLHGTHGTTVAEQGLEPDPVHGTESLHGTRQPLQNTACAVVPCSTPILEADNGAQRDATESNATSALSDGSEESVETVDDVEITWTR